MKEPTVLSELDQKGGIRRYTTIMDVPGGVVMEVAYMRVRAKDRVSNVDATSLVFIPGTTVDAIIAGDSPEPEKSKASGKKR